MTCTKLARRLCGSERGDIEMGASSGRRPLVASQTHGVELGGEDDDDSDEENLSEDGVEASSEDEEENLKADPAWSLLR